MQSKIQLILEIFTLALTVFCGSETAASRLPAREISSQRLSAKISAGSIASIVEFPFAVQLSITRGRRQIQCGGSIIGKNLVLTAAHCLTEVPNILLGSSRNSGYKITAIAGENRRDGHEEESQRRSVKEIRRHPDFKEATLENDLAILVLSEPFEFGGNVQPVTLPEHGQIFDGEAQASGWGTLNAGEFGYRSRNEELRKTDLALLTDTACSSFYNKHVRKFDKEFMLCAGGDERDTCPGDSGGPLICYNADENESRSKSTPYLCGVTSWGDGCGRVKGKHAPGVYTRVESYLTWIHTQIAELGKSLRRRRCSPEQFKCSVRDKCISRQYVCDSVDNCGDGSDEIECEIRRESESGSQPNANATKICSSIQFQCPGTGKCISHEHICDSKDDCENGADELGCGGSRDNGSGSGSNSAWALDGRAMEENHAAIQMPLPVATATSGSNSLPRLSSLLSTATSSLLILWAKSVFLTLR